MNIVLLESLGISDEILDNYKKRFIKLGHDFKSYQRCDDINTQKDRIKNADILIIANMPLKGEVIKSAQRLKFINVAFTGVDHVDLEAAGEKNIQVSNASGYSNDSVAELTICLMLMLLRNVSAVDKRAREGDTKDGLVGNELSGKTVGIIGTGAIGTAVAKLCKAFGCNIIASNNFTKKKSNDLITYMPLKEVLAKADIVTLHCPLTKDSKHLINKDTISYMKPNALLINTARGGVVDSDALADALNSEKIKGAGIDVFESEPPLDVNHPLLHSKNTVVTPHVAFATKESMEKRAKIVFNNVEQWLKGNQVNKIL